jgi:hypothetical protein
MDEVPRGRVKKKFSLAEDVLLRELIQSSDPVNWSAVASHFPDRNGRQCRDRWVNYVNPRIANTPWTPDEERLLEEKFYEFGARWIRIAVSFPRRSASQIKNHWITKQRRLQKLDRLPPSEPKADSRQFPAPKFIAPAPKFIAPADLPEVIQDLFAFDGKGACPWDDFF